MFITLNLCNFTYGPVMHYDLNNILAQETLLYLFSNHKDFHRPC